MSILDRPAELKGAHSKVKTDPWSEASPYGDVDAYPYHCHMCLIAEEDGGYSAIVLNLPGVGSCGDSKGEAIENAREAIAGAIESYREMGEKIPWVNSLRSEIPDCAEQRWILVDDKASRH
jgi:predicted RNase H-like HicB family nuclease